MALTARQLPSVGGQPNLGGRTTGVSALPSSAMLSTVSHRVLIVDDHERFRVTAGRALEAEGWTVVGEAADGAAAIEHTQADVVLLDVGLPERANGPLDTLTPREREVLALMAEGQTNRAIAAKLVVTERAVERHVTSIFDKLGLNAADGGHRRVLAVLTYLRG